MSEVPTSALRKLFVDNEPGLQLLGYSPNHEVTFQLLDCDNVRIGKLRCSGVRMLCVATECQAYSDIEVYEAANLPEELHWLRGVAEFGKYASIYLAMPSKLAGDLAEYSLLPRFSGRPYAFIVCSSFQYLEEDDTGYG